MYHATKMRFFILVTFRDLALTLTRTCYDVDVVMSSRRCYDLRPRLGLLELSW